MGADFRESNLGGTVLVNADLSCADLFGAICIKANLQGANLSKTILRKANFEGAILTDVIWEKPTWPEHHDFDPKVHYRGLKIAGVKGLSARQLDWLKKHGAITRGSGKRQNKASFPNKRIIRQRSDWDEDELNDDLL